MANLPQLPPKLVGPMRAWLRSAVLDLHDQLHEVAPAPGTRLDEKSFPIDVTGWAYSGGPGGRGGVSPNDYSQLPGIRVRLLAGWSAGDERNAPDWDAINHLITLKLNPKASPGALLFEATRNLEHELTHVAQYLLQIEKDTNHPGGLATGRLQPVDRDAYRSDDWVHSNADTELYPLLRDEVAQFRLVHQKADSAQLPRLARAWIAQSDLFRQWREAIQFAPDTASSRHAELKYKKAINSFLHEVTAPPRTTPPRTTPPRKASIRSATHDYDPDTNYPSLDGGVLEEAVARVRSSFLAVAARLGLGAPSIHFGAIQQSRGHIARYVNGTSTAPVIVIDPTNKAWGQLDGWRLEAAVEDTLYHELGHAYFDSVDWHPRDEEKRAEAFGRLRDPKTLDARRFGRTAGLAQQRTAGPADYLRRLKDWLSGAPAAEPEPTAAPAPAAPGAPAAAPAAVVPLPTGPSGQPIPPPPVEELAPADLEPLDAGGRELMPGGPDVALLNDPAGRALNDWGRGETVRVMGSDAMAGTWAVMDKRHRPLPQRPERPGDKIKPVFIPAGTTGVVRAVADKTVMVLLGPPYGSQGAEPMGLFHLRPQDLFNPNTSANRKRWAFSLS